jgi:hypothetical protein
VTVVEWDAVWTSFYEQGLDRGMTPNAAVHRADREMSERHGERPAQDEGTA